MSDATKDALDEAIAAHFADEMGGAIVQGYLLQIAGDSLEDMERNLWSAFRATPDGQAFITTLGLAHYSVRSLEILMTENTRDE